MQYVGYGLELFGSLPLLHSFIPGQKEQVKFIRGSLNLTKMKTPIWRFYIWPTEGGFLGCFQKKNAGVIEARSHAPIFFTIFSLWGMHWQLWISSRSLGGSSACGFIALNLTYYLIECYMEVRRTPDEPKSLWTLN